MSGLAVKSSQILPCRRPEHPLQNAALRRTPFPVRAGGASGRPHPSAGAIRRPASPGSAASCPGSRAIRRFSPARILDGACANDGSQPVVYLTVFPAIRSPTQRVSSSNRFTLSTSGRSDKIVVLLAAQVAERRMQTNCGSSCGAGRKSPSRHARKAPRRSRAVPRRYARAGPRRS